jgi:HEAT repeat protein
VTEPPRTSRAATEKRAALSRELADFLIELSIALHKHAMYPGGHPTLAPAADAVARRLDSILAERGTLSLGVARSQLIIEGVATDPKNPVLLDLAGRLHRHHLGAVSFARGVSGVELEEALKLLAAEADRSGEPLGLKPVAQIPAWPHVRLYPLTFERLELVGDESGEGGGGEVTGGRAAQLWVGLARAALAAEQATPAPKPQAPEPFAFRPEPVPAPESKPLTDAEIDAALGEVKAGELEHATAEPAAVARAIESHERGTAYDQVIVGYLLQIAEELKTAGGAGAVALKKKMGRLITALEPGTLQRLIDMGGDLAQRRQFILDASQGMAVDAVVDILEAASSGGAPISNAMLRMLAKLGHHAERGPAPRRTIAEAALREQVAELVRGWELSDPNPDGYAAALQRMSAQAPTLVAATEAAYEAEPERLLQMAFETGAIGEPVTRAVEGFVAGGRVGDLLGLLERAPETNPATALVRERLVNPDTLKSALAAAPVDFALVDRLAAALGDQAIEPMLDVLSVSESRQVRRGLIDRLVKHGAALGPFLTPRLAADQPWYMLRNVLYLAAETGGSPPVVDALPWRHHDDARVRREALRVLFHHPGERARALGAALADEDPRTKRLALAAGAAGGWPEAAVPLVVALASDDEQDSELRVAAIRALGARGGKLALDALLKLTEIRRRSLLDAVKAAATPPEVLAALAALGALLPEPRARERLEAHARGRDPAAAKAAADALKGAR